MRKSKLRNPKIVVKGHLERVAQIKWDKILTDPRSQINMEWDFNYIMNMAFYGMLTNKRTLREVEDLSENYSDRISDSTFHTLLPRIDPDPLRYLIAGEVKRALRAHELPKEYFPIRLTAVDGKCGSISKQSVGEFSQESKCNGGVQYLNRVLRAVHVSNETKLILAQREILGKKSETTEFTSFIEDLLNLYGRTTLLEVISVDAGMNSLKNADFLIGKGLHYIMALKNPQRRLLKLAREKLERREDYDKETIERANGKEVTRRLYRCEAPLDSKWTHLKQFWLIQQETKEKGKISIEERYFMTSLEYDKLNDEQVLKAIRMHWGVENNANWIFDGVWKEDDSPWCNKAFVFVTLLRILAYNIISRLKTRRLREKNDRERSWGSLLLMVYTVFIEMKNEITIQVLVHPNIA